MEVFLESDDEFRPLILPGTAACSLGSTVPSSPASSVGTPDASSSELHSEKRHLQERNGKDGTLKKGSASSGLHSSSSSDSSTSRKPLDVDDDFGEDSSLRTLFVNLRIAARRLLFHPAAVSPFCFHHFSSPRGVSEHNLGDVVSPSRSTALSASADRSASGWLPATWTLPQPGKLVEGLSWRGCMCEVLGTFLVALLVHASARAATLTASSLNGDGDAEPTLGGWAIAARLPLLLYAVAALLGVFCNPAFLYAAYTAFASSSASAPSVCDASRMNCFSVNLLVCLQYLAAGAGAFFAVHALPLDRGTAETTTKQDLLLSPQVAWQAFFEALGACLMGAAVLQLVALSSFFRSSREEVASLSLRQRSLDRAAGGRCAASALPSSSSLRRSFFSRPFLFFGKKEDLLTSAFEPQKRFGKPRAWAVALPFLLLLLAWSLPVSRSSLNPAVAYASNCARRQAERIFAISRGSTAEIPGALQTLGAPDGGNRGSSGVRTPEAYSQLAASGASAGSEARGGREAEVRGLRLQGRGAEAVAGEKTGAFLELDSSFARSATSSFPPGVVFSRGISSRDASPAVAGVASAAASQRFAGVSAGPVSRLPDGVAFSLLDVEQEAPKTERVGGIDRGGQTLPGAASDFFEEQSEQKLGLPTFLLPPGISPDKDVEGIQILGREEGDGEILFEFDEACATASPWLSFFLLFSAAPYFGAFAAALIWTRFGGVEQQFCFQENASLN
ncbi:putative transmembrane protein [Toxoplasma gondii GAB2-2007-GAL-DOM2]|uniref:Transmembrane protein n=8 Tax=Toxoplasma gondii TaxID=5811 RepID=S7V287_TOXGG|nr:hypothetical protein TGGT1_230840 [Toxoplasma gondii GT1]KAF4641704.1 hypothetical protein TGRH88_075140 [Toxoplasma gondii]KFG48385.1 putative transmembrane protein [Toxoplasma gondii GAB2-2007-GAL-DOM2]KFG55461.1 putative transmembrane protein [Toxoplasma gondii FOU]